MKTLTRDTRIASMFMLAEPYENYGPLDEQMICMPKLNGIRAMWIPGRGFWSRDGMQYSPAVTDHIRINSPVPVDGEFYVHGWPLQRINAAVGVNLDEPTEDTTSVIFHAFDVYNPTMIASMRYGVLLRVVVDSECNNFTQVVQKHLLSEDQEYWFNEWIKNGYEGMMLKSPNVGYVPGRTKHLLKRKNWRYLQAKVLSLHEGKGELAGMFGGAEMELATGQKFNAGTAKGLTHVERIAIWKNPASLVGSWRDIRYIELSEDKKPLNATIVL